jgi:excinuclease ABC subunit C
MLGAKGEFLYVGKARNLKKRVQNYVHLTRLGPRLRRMVQDTAALEIVTTHTEAEALLLEANLIKRHKPRYNIVLRDDKSLPGIMVTADHAFPQVLKHRGAQSRPGDYFGPFASAWSVNRTLVALQRAFLLRSCSDAVFSARTRPCLLHQIKRCSAPCTGLISLEDHATLVAEAEAFLGGRSQAVKAELAGLMEQAAERLDFEQAARYRDRIAALSFVTAQQGINPAGVEEADVFAIAQDGGQTCIQVFFFRSGQNWGNRAYFLRGERGLERAEVFASFLAQFYDDKPLPALILLSEEVAERELVAEAFSQRAGKRLEVLVPQRGEKRQLAEHAATNAREALSRRLAETISQKKILEGVAAAFGLAKPPQRIEVYDNSHIQGSDAVGAMIVAGPDGLLKTNYRKFNIRSQELQPGDDFGMMREVIRRRFSRLVREHGPPGAPVEDNGAEAATAPAWPDLVLIDGGQGQLSAAREALSELGLADLPVAGVAKGEDRDAGRERFHMAGRPSFMLDSRDPVLYYVQRLRDEAHRFAIGSHRARRAKGIAANPLDEIDGIGPERKRALLRAFGSARAVSRASAADLAAVDGISTSLARTIYEHFHDGGE